MEALNTSVFHVPRLTIIWFHDWTLLKYAAVLHSIYLMDILADVEITPS